MIRALAFLLLSALPAWATVDGWPALHDVTGVAADDVLNIRSEPGAAGDVIGSFAPDATGIEVIRPNDDLTWGLVNHGEGTGWVSLTYLARHPGQWDGRFPAIRRCFGTEPFWNLAVSGAEVTLSGVDIPQDQGLISGNFSSLARRDRFALKGFIRSSDAGPLDMVLTLHVAACNDGMSDRDYGIGVDMLLTDPQSSDGTRPAHLYSGCCSIQPPAAQ